MTCQTARKLSFATVVAAALAMGTVAAPAPAQAQVRALLPTIDQVEPLEDLAIDGTWRIREIGKRIVIDNGHAYADETWVHAFVFRIEPGQVVIKNIRELANGDFVARDLPLMAGVTFVWLDEDTLVGRTDGLVPVTYHLDRVDELDGSFGDDFAEAPDDEEFRRPPSAGDDEPLIELPETDPEEEQVEPW